ncbi:hypothetical protein V6N13_086294 [Hibiscus sabdariffa]|uniref:Chlorophyll a-b binding protein, chloroplastic n=1 Tax=Hibiscus sabdariffa TaxID=183260 RepID=A0ABR2FSY1_9ROSI
MKEIIKQADTDRENPWNSGFDPTFLGDPGFHGLKGEEKQLWEVVSKKKMNNSLIVAQFILMNVFLILILA